MKDVITYQNWCWDLFMYHHTGCQESTLLPNIIHSLQDYPGKLVRSSGADITLEGILTILDEHYNYVMALDALNQELFWLQMGENETVSEWGVCLSRHLQIFMAVFPEHFLPDHISKLKCDHFYGGLPKQFKVMVVYLKASGNDRMYSYYLWVVWEAKKEEEKEASHNPPTASTSRPRVISCLFCTEAQRQSFSHNPLHMSGTPGRRKCQWGEIHQWWWPRWHWRCNWRAHCMPHQAGKDV